MTHQAWSVRRRSIFAAALLFTALAAWSIHHVGSTVAAVHGNGTRFGAIYTLAFVMLCWQMLLCYREKPYAVTDRQAQGLARMHVVVNVPVYNEDPAALRACLESLLRQTRPVDTVHVVDDGSLADYSDIEPWFKSAAYRQGVLALWTRQDNAGKRQAQGRTVRDTPWADVYLTVDSDAILAPDAVAEGMKPLADPKVQSVAGVVLAVNNRKNLLARLTDLWFVTGQLVDRSAMSAMGSVLVNSGVLAFYRADVLRDNLDGYLNETFFGRKVEFSDDSMLTIYALERGRAVQQPTAFAFTLMPERVDHHLRQQLRWMRGAFIRSWWRFRYLPLSGYAYWGHLMSWVQWAVSSVVFMVLFVIDPIRNGWFDPFLLVVPLAIGYGMSLRYLGVRRNDEPLRSQVLTFALSPLASLWSFFVLRPLRWYAMLTCLKTGWGTRSSVEIEMGTAEIPRQRAGTDSLEPA